MNRREFLSAAGVVAGAAVLGVAAASSCSWVGPIEAYACSDCQRHVAYRFQRYEGAAEAFSHRKPTGPLYRWEACYERA